MRGPGPVCPCWGRQSGWMCVGSSLLRMCVGSALLRMVRLVESSIPDLFVVLQLKSLCLALKSPSMSTFLLVLVMVLMSLSEGCIPGGQY